MYAAEDDVEGRVIVHATALSRSRVDYVLSFQRSNVTVYCDGLIDDNDDDVLLEIRISYTGEDTVI